MSLIRAVVDSAALRHNLARVRAAAPGARVMAVVKANGYGHGLVPVALALSDADAFAVARLEEGLQLRDAGVRRPIVLLEGVFTNEQLAEAAAADIDMVVHDPMQIALLEAYRGPQRLSLWVKVDTGMNRLGFRVEDFGGALERLQALTVPAHRLRLLTHLARADEPDSPMTHDQVARFATVVRRARQACGAGFRLETSIGNSAGTLAWPEARGDWIRPGLALYGVSPFADRVGTGLGLRPAMRLETTVIALKRVPRGETVGYGGSWRAARESRVAILAAGYGDGVPRQLASGAPVLVRGQLAQLAGRVSMDMLAVDVTDLGELAVGDAAVMWGPELPVEEVAARAGTIAYELLCGVSQRVPVRFD